MKHRSLPALDRTWLLISWFDFQSTVPLAKQGDVLEFSDICKKYLGKPGEFIAILFSVAANAGGAIVFWVLMSSFLFYSGKYIHGNYLLLY